MCEIERWLGNEVIRRSQITVPAIVAAYNIFMNSVDRMDQLRAAAPCRRKETRLNMSLFTWVLDLSVHNAYSVFSHLRTEDHTIENIPFQEFK